MLITTRLPEELIASDCCCRCCCCCCSKLSAKSVKDPLASGVSISFDGDNCFVRFPFPEVFDLWNESIKDHSGVSGELGLFGEMLSRTDSPL